MADEVGIVTQDEAGNWYCDGELCTCSLGGHEGMARARSLSRRLSAMLARLSGPERERVLERARAGFGTLDDLQAGRSRPAAARGLVDQQGRSSECRRYAPAELPQRDRRRD